MKEKGRFLQQLSRGRREVGSDSLPLPAPSIHSALLPLALLPGCASVFGARITLRARFSVWAIFGGGLTGDFYFKTGRRHWNSGKISGNIRTGLFCVLRRETEETGVEGGRSSSAARSSARRSLTVISDPAHPICLSGSGGHSLRRGPDRTTERESLRTHRHCAQGCNRKVVKRERERERER